MAVLLYYPRVNPPREILHKALLYWDGIATVVPHDPDDYAAAVQPELTQLREQGLYTPLFFMRQVMDVLNFPRWDFNSQVLLEEIQRMAESPARPRLPSPPEAYLYRSKFSEWVEMVLLQHGLAERIPDDSRYAVPKEVQHLVVSVLAREWGTPFPASYVPYTDRSDAYEWALRAHDEQRLPAFRAELGRLLPVPAPGTSTADVLVFRERFNDERQRLMRALHRLLTDLRRDYEHPAEVIAELRREIEAASKDYQAAVSSSRMAWVHRSVTATVALAAAAASAVEPNLTWALGLVGGYTLNVATREIRPLKDARKKHDFAYLHRVETAFS
ncbi:hypothetical protein [Streptomyces sp. RTd22]|uniref:hypothetical protein n=1 Tax=Streptomyces sp. RTd22 TaxID=1841249 RepID=UPI0007C4EEFD|nr:hypothetical protein [Streptomyces sp. RTd22]